MVTLKPPKNVFTSLEIDAGTDINTAVFAPAVLTTAEINSIPLDDLRAGGIVYNISVGSLQTYTINGWENIAVSGGGTDIFDNITVNNTATINTLNVSGTSTLGTVNSSGTITAGTLASTGNITAAFGVTGSNYLAAGDNGQYFLSNEIATGAGGDFFAAGTIYGSRVGAQVYSTSTSAFTVTANVPQKIATASTTGFLHQFTSPVAGRLQYVGTLNSGVVATIINASFSAVFSTAATITLLVALNGVPQNPGTFMQVSTTSFNLTLPTAMGLLTNDYLELWVVSTVDGTFSAAGAMTMTVTQT